jgi:hypothetical protein
LTGTVWLEACAARAIGRLLKGIGKEADEIVVTCGALHLAFITLMFGNRWSWPYYCYLLVLGIAASTKYCTTVFSRAPVWTLIFLTSTGHTIGLRNYYHIRTTESAGANTQGLLANQSLRREWERVTLAATDERASLISGGGSASLMFSEFAKPTALFLIPGLTLQNEAVREAQQVSNADLVVVWRDPFAAPRTAALDVPGMRQALDGTKKIWEGQYFVIYQRSVQALWSEPPSYLKTSVLSSRALPGRAEPMALR